MKAEHIEVSLLYHRVDAEFMTLLLKNGLEFCLYHFSHLSI